MTTDPGLVRRAQYSTCHATVAAPACVPRLPPPTKTSLLNLKTSTRRGEYPSRCSTRAIAHDMAPIGGRNHVLADGGGSCVRLERLVTQFREQPNTSKAETLARVLALTHALYWTASIHEDELLNEDTLRVWMTGTPEEACELVRKMSRRNEARLERKDPSFSTKRHGVSGLPLCAPHPSILPSRV